ncbi:MAG: hypothetical protein KDC53_17635 [Saprospiraceae bacterium]|nr:hypothetical protein [Saprospiraceae bacterium]
MIRLITILFSLSTLMTYGQSKEDIIAVFKAASQLSELDPLFQVDLSAGPTMVLVKNNRLSSGSNEVERNYWSLTNDDFWGFDRPIKIMTEQEAGFEGVRNDQLVSASLSFSGDQCNLGFTATIDEGTRYLQGWISLTRSGFDWEVTGQNIRTR